VADSWLMWLGSVVAVAFMALFALAGMPLAGVFLAAVVWLSARSAVTPAARAEVDDAARRVCDRLPFCDCSTSQDR
jgi:type IV secretory pathway TrbF-like protein